MGTFNCVFLVLLIVNSSYGGDPCLDAEPLHSPGKRGSECMISKSQKQVCDHFIKKDWYKIQHEDDNSPRQMIDKCLAAGYCGTFFNVWLNGSHPAVNGEIVNRTACQSGVYTCCDESYDIQIKKCTGYYVYRLPPTSLCKASYCFGINEKCAIDPCDDETYTLLNDNGDRSAHCKRENNQLCDDKLKNGWYRVQKNHREAIMPNSCVETLHCGTQHPLWLNGKLPFTAERTQTREVCLSGKVSCCEKKYKIQIRNCSSFLVYNLTTPSACPERYCFGNAACEQKSNKGPESTCDTQCLLNIILPTVVLGVTLVILGVGLIIYLMNKHSRQVSVQDSDKTKKKQDAWKADEIKDSRQKDVDTA